MIDRIQKIIQQKKLSSSGFADMIGVPRSTISHLLSGRNNPSLEFIQKVLDAFPEINTDWLIRGKGPMNYGHLSKVSETSEAAPPVKPKEWSSQGSLFQELQPATNKNDKIKNFEEATPSLPLSDSHESLAAIQKERVDENRAVMNLDEKNKKEDIYKKKHDNEVINLDKKVRKPVRILLIYSDGTFSDYLPEVKPD